MMEKLQKETEMQLSIRKGKDFIVSISKTSKLGLDIAYQNEKDYIFIKKVLDGAVKTYNASAPAGARVDPPSRIVGVNGFRGTAKDMFAKMQADGATIEL